MGEWAKGRMGAPAKRRRGEAQIWWGEAPERPVQNREASSVIFRTGVTTPQNAPSRGLSWATARHVFRPCSRSVRDSAVSFGHLHRSFGRLAQQITRRIAVSPFRPHAHSLPLHSLPLAAQYRLYGSRFSSH
jgi:hypothetical protein